MKRLFTVLAAAMMLAGFAQAQDFNTAVETFNNGAIAIQAGNNVEALALFKEALTQFEACGEEGEEKVAECKKIIPGTMLAIAKGLINNKEYDNAISCLKETSAVATEYGVAEVSDEALSLVPNALMRKGSLLFRDKDFENAAATLAEVVGLEPENGQAFLMLGQSYLQLGKNDEAISALNSASENGKADQAVKLLGNIFLKQGQNFLKDKKYAEAIEAIEKANTYVENAQAYKLLASACMKSGKTPKALEAYKKYVELAPNAKDAADVKFTIAATAQKAGDKATAIEYYSQLLNTQYAASAQQQLATLKK